MFVSMLCSKASTKAIRKIVQHIHNRFYFFRLKQVVTLHHQSKSLSAMNIKNFIGTSADIQLSIKSQPIKRNRHKVSPLEQRNYGRVRNPLFYAIMYGCVLAGILIMLLSKSV